MAAGEKFYPTAEQRKQVKEDAGNGLTRAQIATRLDIGPSCLDRHFKKELEAGKPDAIAKVAGKLFSEAMDGNTAAMIFWLKSQAGWKEAKEQEQQRQPFVVNIKIKELKSQIEAIEAKAKLKELPNANTRISMPKMPGGSGADDK